MNRTGYEYTVPVSTTYYASNSRPPQYDRGYGQLAPVPVYSPTHPLSNYADIYEGNNDTTLRAEEKHWYIENHKSIQPNFSNSNDNVAQEVKIKKEEEKKVDATIPRSEIAQTRQRRKENRCSCECWPISDNNDTQNTANGANGTTRSLSGVDMVASYGVYGNPQDDESSGFGRLAEKPNYGQTSNAPIQGVIVNQQGNSAVIRSTATDSPSGKCCMWCINTQEDNSEDYCWIHYCKPALIVLLLLFFLILLGVSTGFLLTNNYLHYQPRPPAPEEPGDPCTAISCQVGARCIVTYGQAECRCPRQCQRRKLVCGTDGKEYPSACHLDKHACENQLNITVKYHGKCAQHPCESVKCGLREYCTLDVHGVAVCGCGPDCEEVIRPVCGSDGRTYDNPCLLDRTACLENRDIRVAYIGACGVENPCARASCPWGGACVARGGSPHCSCPVCDSNIAPICASDFNTYGSECKMRMHACQASLRENEISVLYNGTCQVVCGTDGLTYRSQCDLESTACREQSDLRLAFSGDCALCDGVQCSYGAHCLAGECVCPTDCTGAPHEPVCASTMETYPNECEIQKAACGISPPTRLHVIFYGDCKDRLAIVPPIAMTTTAMTTTEAVESTGFLGATEFGTTSASACRDIRCDFDASCEIGSDGYPRCSCLFECPTEDEYFPVCASDFRLYPSLCVMRKEGCQKQLELRLRPLDLCKGMEVRPCGNNKAMIDLSTGLEIDCGNGPHRQDCPVGSYCHITLTAARCCPKNETKQVEDKRIVLCTESKYGCCADGSSAAIGPNEEGCPITSSSCGCNRLGSLSDRCDDSAESVAVAESCAELSCYFGAVCTERTGGALCECAAGACPDSDLNMLVCGSDGKTYESECHLKLQACRTQEDIVVQAFGPCKLSEVQGTAGPPRPSSPIQFTQQDDGAASKSTRHLLNPDKYYNKYDWMKKETPSDFDTILSGQKHKGDLCTEDSDCSALPGAQCARGGCVCRLGYIPTMNRKACVEQLAQETTEEYSACLSEPCYNLGTCIDLPGSTYACVCADHYTGTNCETGLKEDSTITYIDTPAFDGSAYIRLKPLKAYHKFNIDIEFKAFSQNGVILYNQQKIDGTGDFVSLALVNGYLEFRYNLGNGAIILKSPERISLNEYHKVSAKRYHRDGILSVDNMDDVADVNVVEETWSPQFNGTSYVELMPLEGLGKSFRIEIWFLTNRFSGVLLYTGQSNKAKGDFIAINLVNGYLQFRYNLGSGVANITQNINHKKESMRAVQMNGCIENVSLMLNRSPVGITKGRWHRVRVARRIHTAPQNVGGDQQFYWSDSTGFREWESTVSVQF
ncbi:unnamed protein product [Leptidea sinapis]|uniref:Agrin n=1 Tax=Leptidea sinapis TaxID=189913 RepID=A0A5E4QJ41_9NEOP|nr:unnamed protein product [Leptidea sinapis]